MKRKQAVSTIMEGNIGYETIAYGWDGQIYRWARERNQWRKMHDISACDTYAHWKYRAEQDPVRKIFTGKITIEVTQ